MVLGGHAVAQPFRERPLSCRVPICPFVAKRKAKQFNSRVSENHRAEARDAHSQLARCVDCDDFKGLQFFYDFQTFL